MVLSDEMIKRCTKRLLLARAGLLCSHGFFGLMLMQVGFELNEGIGTAGTDGMTMYFNPYFMEGLTDEELSFILMHEVMHMALRHCSRKGSRDMELFNMACDIVVNSNILKANDMDLKAITVSGVGVSMHKAPDGREGYLYTSEQVYDMLLQKNPAVKASQKMAGGASHGKGSKGTKDESYSGCDDHSMWGNESPEERYENDAIWQNRLKSAENLLKDRAEAGSQAAGMPPGIERRLRALSRSRMDWRMVLHDFIQEDIVDYSFMPPDRRFGESPFFLPDFNEKDETVSNLLFMVDCSGSVSDNQMTEAYSEVRGAIDQFDGKLSGWLGFFDTGITEPKPFNDIGELMKIKPQGGGGTRFDQIFEYVRTEMNVNRPSMIIILTDGYARFPEEQAADGIPVLWVLNNDHIDPPWGKVARITY